jgi:taurine dioxygenase
MQRILHKDFGLEIRGIDLRADAIRTIRDALEKHSLLVVRQQALSGDRLVEFGRRLGGGVSELKRFETPGPSTDQPWHAVGAIDGDPALATVLCVRIAPERGGGMEFTSTRALFESLSQEERDALERVTATHVFRAAPDRRVSYPLVVRHRPDAAPALLLGYHLVAVDPPTPQPIAALMAAATSADRVYRHDFEAGDVLIWDNASLMHRACALREGERRVVEEVAIARA